MAPEHRLAQRKGLRRARGHHGHLAGGGLGLAARHRPVDHQDAALGEPRAEPLGVVGRHGDAHDEHAALAHRRRRAVLAEQHRLGLLGVHHQHDDDIAGRAELGRAGAGHGADVDERLHDLGPHVAHAHRKVGAQQRFRDPAAHRAQPDHADLGFVHGRSLFRVVDDDRNAGMVQRITGLVHRPGAASGKTRGRSAGLCSRRTTERVTPPRVTALSASSRQTGLPQYGLPAASRHRTGRLRPASPRHGRTREANLRRTSSAVTKFSGSPLGTRWKDSWTVPSRITTLSEPDRRLG